MRKCILGLLLLSASFFIQAGSLPLNWKISDSQINLWLQGEDAVGPDGPSLSFKIICDNSKKIEIFFKAKEYIELKEPPEGLTPKEVEYSLGQKSFYKNVPYQEVIVYPLIKNPSGDGNLLLTSFNAEIDGVDDIKSSYVDFNLCDASLFSGLFLNYWEGCKYANKEFGYSQKETIFSTLPTATTSIYRVNVKQDGIIKLTKEYLDSISVNLSGADPRNFHLYSRGVEIPIIVEGEGDGSFDSGDAIVFYGQKMAVKDRNVWNGGDFTDTNVYFLYGDAIPGLRMQNLDASPSNPTFLLTTTYYSSLNFEENSFMYPGHLRPNGELWFWSPALYYLPGAGEINRAISLTIPHPVLNSDNFTISLLEAGFNNVNHILDVKLNSSSYQSLNFNGKTIATLNYTFLQNQLNSSGSNTLTLRIPSSQTVTDNQILDYISLQYLRTTECDNNSLLIEDSGGNLKYKATGFSSNPYIFDLSEYDSATKLYLPKHLINAYFNSGEITFDYADIGKSRKCAISSSPLLPDLIELVNSRNLTDQDLSCDFLIITHPDFHPSGSDSVWQNYLSRRNSRFLYGAKFVDIQEIYDNFSYGIFDPTAIKSFLTYAKNNWVTFPSYLLLVGDSSYDYKNYMNDSTFKNWVPTMTIENVQDIAYQGWLASDSFFCDVNGDGYPDLSVGRIPVRNYSEFSDVLSKIMTYEDATLTSEWYKKMFFVADTYDEVWEEEFENYNNYLLNNYSLSPYNYLKVFYHDSPYNGTDQDRCATDIRNYWDDAILVHFAGHSASKYWGYHDGILSLTAARGSDLNNLPTITPPYAPLPFVVNSTCFNNGFSYQGPDCLFEAFLKPSNKGVIGSTGYTTISYIEEDEQFTTPFFQSLFGVTKKRTIGDVVETARFALPSTNSRPILSLVLLADPTLKIRLPSPLAPTNLTATPLNQSASLTWSHPSTPPYGYNVYRSVDGTTFSKINSSLVLYPDNSYLDSSLTNNQTYYYYATSVDSEEFESAISNIVSATPLNPNPPSVPTGLSVTDLGTGDSLRVSWNPNGESDLSSYKLYWGTQSAIYTNSQLFSKSVTSTQITGLTTNTTYFFALTAINTSNKESSYSQEVSGKPTNAPVAVNIPAMITDLMLQKNGNDIILNWSKPLYDIKGNPITVASFDIYRVVNQYNYSLDEVNLNSPNAKINVVAQSGVNSYSYTDVGAVNLAPTITYLVVAKDSSGNRSPASVDPPSPILSLKLQKSSTNGATIIFFDQVNTTINGAPTIITKYYLYGFYPMTSSKDHISPTNTISPLNPAVLAVPLSSCENGGYYCDSSTSPPIFYSVVAVDNRGNRSLY